MTTSTTLVSYIEFTDEHKTTFPVELVETTRRSFKAIRTTLFMIDRCDQANNQLLELVIRTLKERVPVLDVITLVSILDERYSPRGREWIELRMQLISYHVTRQVIAEWQRLLRFRTLGHLPLN